MKANAPDRPRLGSGVLRKLRDEHYSNRVGILFGAVTWPNKQDIDPETLLAEMLPVESAAQRLCPETARARPPHATP